MQALVCIFAVLAALAGTLIAITNLRPGGELLLLLGAALIVVALGLGALAAIIIRLDALIKLMGGQPPGNESQHNPVARWTLPKA